MTIGAAWIRPTKEGDEVWIASDSRLSGDELDWDQCPKLVTLPRRDSVMAFSGSTRQAYPLMMQLSNAIASYGAAATGALEFFKLLGHLERVANDLMTSIKPSAGHSDQGPVFSSDGDTIVVAGYSRLHGKPVIRSIGYDGAGQWRLRTLRPGAFGPNRLMLVFGDAKAKSRLRYMLKTDLAASNAPKHGGWSFEPLLAIERMLRMPALGVSPLPAGFRPSTVGGAPQVMRIVPGADVTTFAVRWATKGLTAEYINGRRAFSYERLDAPLIEFVGGAVKTTAPGAWSVPEDRPKRRVTVRRSTQASEPGESD